MIQITMADKLHRTAFLGQEFLTWLMFRSFRDRSIAIDNDVFGITMEKAVVLEGDNPSTESCAIRTNEPANDDETMLALRLGKKVAKVRAILTVGGYDFGVTLNAVDLHPRGLTLPEVKGMDLIEHVDARLALMDDFDRAIRALFLRFISIRTSSTEWDAEASEIAAWLEAAS